MGPGQGSANQRKHGLSFATAQLVFGDPLALSRPDPTINEERWQTVGKIGQVTVFVVHTGVRRDATSSEEVGRIIGVRKATASERKSYEEGQF